MGATLIIRSGSSRRVIVRPSNFSCTLQHRASVALHLCTVALVMSTALKTHADAPFTSRPQQSCDGGQQMNTDQHMNANQAGRPPQQSYAVSGAHCCQRKLITL